MANHAKAPQGGLPWWQAVEQFSEADLWSECRRTAEAIGALLPGKPPYVGTRGPPLSVIYENAERAACDSLLGRLRWGEIIGIGWCGGVSNTDPAREIARDDWDYLQPHDTLALSGVPGAPQDDRSWHHCWLQRTDARDTVFEGGGQVWHRVRFHQREALNAMGRLTSAGSATEEELRRGVGLWRLAELLDPVEKKKIRDNWIPIVSADSLLDDQEKHQRYYAANRRMRELLLESVLAGEYELRTLHPPGDIFASWKAISTDVLERYLDSIDFGPMGPPKIHFDGGSIEIRAFRVATPPDSAGPGASEPAPDVGRERRESSESDSGDANSGRVRGGYSRAELKRWFSAWVELNQESGSIPTRDVTLEAAKKSLNARIPRREFADYWRKFVPNNWKDPGPRPATAQLPREKLVRFADQSAAKAKDASVNTKK